MIKAVFLPAFGVMAIFAFFAVLALVLICKLVARITGALALLVPGIFIFFMALVTGNPLVFTG